MNQHDRELYEAGRKARLEGKTRDACPYGMGELKSRSWWLAGWHDLDLEIMANETAIHH